jgi:beta-lactamase regulating signal transducer with metallopeptidase domain
MFISVSDLLPAVARATVALSLSAAIAWGLLRWFKPQSPRLHRIIWMLVLLQGIILLRIPVAVPWYAQDSGITVPRVVGAVPSATRDMEEAKISAHPVLTANESNHSIDWRGIICGMWLAGCGGTLIWWASVHLRVSRSGACSEGPSQEWASQWQNLLEQCVCKKAIPLRVTRDTGPLLVWRLGGTAVLVPRSLWESLSSQQRLAILRHELAHYRRGDLWKGALIRLMALPHWFNPMAWWIVRNLDESAEWLCDDDATGRDRGIATEYAEVLLRLGQKVRNYGLAATAMRGGRLHRRICRVLTPRPVEKSPMKKYLLIAVPLALLAGHVIRVELVARAQIPAVPGADDSQTKAAPSDKGPSTTTRPRTGVSIRGNFLGPDGVRVALSYPAVQKEIGIEKDSSQFEEFEKLKQAQVNEIQAALTKLFNEGRNTPENSQEVFNGVRAKHLLETKNLLKPEQAARLRQIILQDAEAESLLDDEVAKQLNITKDQQEKLAALVREAAEKQREILKPSDDKPPDNEVIKEKVQKLQQLNADRDKKAIEILTAAQQQKFAEMKGKPFDLTQLPHFRPMSGASRASARRGMPISVGSSLISIALLEPILKELGIENDSPQVAELRKLADAYKKDLRDSVREHTPVDAASLPELDLKLKERVDSELKKVLMPEQYTRLRQIVWQMAGSNDLSYPDLAKELDITPQQREKLDDLTVEMFRKRVAIFNPNGGRGPPDVDEAKKNDALNAQWSTKVNEILSKAQQEKLAELRGKPFDMSLLSSQPSGAGTGLPAQKPDETKEDKKE